MLGPQFARENAVEIPHARLSQIGLHDSKIKLIITELQQLACATVVYRPFGMARSTEYEMRMLKPYGHSHCRLT